MEANQVRVYLLLKASWFVVAYIAYVRLVKKFLKYRQKGFSIFELFENCLYPEPTAASRAIVAS